MTTPPRPGSGPSQQIRRRRTVIALVIGLVLLSSAVGLLRGGNSRATTPAGPPATVTAPSTSQRTTSSPVSPSTQTATPTPTAVPTAGNGTFTTVAVPRVSTATTGRVVTYALQIENGLGTVDLAQVARTVGADLLDPRGWQGVDHVRFVQLSAAELAKGRTPTVYITLASPKTVDKLCAPLSTKGEWSCGRYGRAVLNYERWALGVPYFNGDLTTYRAYLVNHEVGHLLGHGHQHCAAPGAYAPVMQQQSMGLQGCKPWPWPSRPAGG